MSRDEHNALITQIQNKINNFYKQNTVDRNVEKLLYAIFDDVENLRLENFDDKQRFRLTDVRFLWGEFCKVITADNEVYYRTGLTKIVSEGTDNIKTIQDTFTWDELEEIVEKYGIQQFRIIPAREKGTMDFEEFRRKRNDL